MKIYLFVNHFFKQIKFVSNGIYVQVIRYDFLGQLIRRCLKRNPGEFLSISKLSKETEFDVSRVGALLKHLNSL